MRAGCCQFRTEAYAFALTRGSHGVRQTLDAGGNSVKRLRKTSRRTPPRREQTLPIADEIENLSRRGIADIYTADFMAELEKEYRPDGMTREEFHQTIRHIGDGYRFRDIFPNLDKADREGRETNRGRLKIIEQFSGHLESWEAESDLAAHMGEAARRMGVPLPTGDFPALTESERRAGFAHYTELKRLLALLKTTVELEITANSKGGRPAKNAGLDIMARRAETFCVDVRKKPFAVDYNLKNYVARRFRSCRNWCRKSTHRYRIGRLSRRCAWLDVVEQT